MNTNPNYSKNLITVAIGLGIGSIITAFMLPLIVPGILGAMAITLAVIGTGRAQRMPRLAWIAMLLGIAGLAVHIAVIGVSGYTVYQIFTDSTVRSQYNEIIEQMYGYSIDDVIDAIENGSTLTVPDNNGGYEFTIPDENSGYEDLVPVNPDGGSGYEDLMQVMPEEDL